MTDEKLPPLPLTLRETTTDDIPALAAIEAACLPQPWSRESLVELLSNEHAVCIAAVSEGKIIGYGSMYCIAGEGDVNNIAVLPAFRRRGAGGRILKALILAGESRGASSFFLEVRTSNASARSLYLKNGFAETGYRKNYYRAPREDAVCMALRREALLPGFPAENT